LWLHYVFHVQFIKSDGTVCLRYSTVCLSAPRATTFEL